MKEIDISKTLRNANQAYNKAQYNQAYSLIKKVNKINRSKNFNYLEFEAKVLIKLGRLNKALVIYQELIKLADTDSQLKLVYKHIGELQLKNSQNQEAIKAFENCLSIDNSIENAQVTLMLCKLYRKQGRYSASIELATRLKSWSDYFAPALHQLILIAKIEANTEQIVIRTKELSRNFRQISEFYIYYSIQTFISVSCFDEAESLLNKTENFLGNVPWLDRVRAELSFKNKEYRRVIELLDNALIQKLPSWMYKSLVYQLRAKAYEKIGVYQKAFRDFSSMAKVVKSQVTNVNIEDDVKKYMALELESINTNNQFQDKFSLSFMIGFPRSGTTMLDTILSTQENVVVLSEIDAISHVTNFIRTEFKKVYPRDLVKLTKEELQILRNEYYNFVSQLPQADKINNNTLVLDKMPLNVIHMPLIMMMFPNTKFIFSLRHPLDVCLSNFQQDYVLNQEMYHLIDLKDCAKRYAQIFNLLEIYKNKLAPDIHFIKYENLIHNLSTEVQTLFKYLHIKGNSDYSSFHKLAETRYINTPSRDQVKQQLYTSSVNKWMNYNDHLIDIRPILKPFIDRFGYTD